MLSLNWDVEDEASTNKKCYECLWANQKNLFVSLK